MTPAFQGEVQFRRYSDTSTQGQQVVFAVQDREALESFVGMEGKRFMAVLVQIGDDEQPVPQIDKNGRPVKQREYLGDLCWRAVQWCNDPEFQKWYGARSADEAREDMLVQFQIKSRKDLDANPEAAEAFRRLVVGPWQKFQLARRSA